MEIDLESLKDHGDLRVAINTGNRALVQQVDGGLRGVSPALARRLADHLKARMIPVLYSGAGPVFADADKDVWDVAFLAIDPIRARKVSFTRPYHRIEATFATRRGSPFSTPGEVDRPGVTILSSVGSAYDLWLKANLQHATLDHAATPGESFAAFRAGQGDVVAGIRASLHRAFSEDDEIEVMDGTLTSVDQAMVLPRPKDPRIAALDMFVEHSIADGFVADELEKSAR
ncbi:putative extracellular solute-binding protein [Roseibacterium elongatum DSM 19469]|uniref:Putative extracellular solute-binding protein n=1 Tax=Roseicyclus elongatus DSM 19469 TaxID=1294273 RepID=W8SM83_9RHOB|nr:transporter substrate-binding domain-containing protein [Roseibacterium elongatum]AHM03655.1 putative extracellular solute-binding protein [Roseibacterium elongatum DSM 19469]